MAPSTQAAAAVQSEEQNLAMCQQVDSLLAGLQSSWDALHQHSQACLDLGLTPDALPCFHNTPFTIPISEQPPDPKLSSILTANTQQQQLQQPLHRCGQSYCLQQWLSSANSDETHVPDDQAARQASVLKHTGHQPQQPKHAPLPDSMLGPGLAQQPHMYADALQSAQIQQSASVKEGLKLDERSLLSAESMDIAGEASWLMGNLFLRIQKLWEHLIYDTQMVSQTASSAIFNSQAASKDADCSFA